MPTLAPDTTSSAVAYGLRQPGAASPAPAAPEPTLADLLTEITTLKSQISNLKAELSDFSALKTQLAAQAAENASLKSEIADLKSEIPNPQSAIRNLQSMESALDALPDPLSLDSLDDLAAPAATVILIDLRLNRWVRLEAQTNAAAAPDLPLYDRATRCQWRAIGMRKTLIEIRDKLRHPKPSPSPASDNQQSAIDNPQSKDPFRRLYPRHSDTRDTSRPDIHLSCHANMELANSCTHQCTECALYEIHKDDKGWAPYHHFYQAFVLKENMKRAEQGLSPEPELTPGDYTFEHRQYYNEVPRGISQEDYLKLGLKPILTCIAPPVAPIFFNTKLGFPLPASLAASGEWTDRTRDYDPDTPTGLPLGPRTSPSAPFANQACALNTGSADVSSATPNQQPSASTEHASAHPFVVPPSGGIPATEDQSPSADPSIPHSAIPIPHSRAVPLCPAYRSAATFTRALHHTAKDLAVLEGTDAPAPNPPAQQATNDEQLSTNNKQLTTNNEQLTTNNEQPPTNNEQLSTDNEQLTTNTPPLLSG